MAIKALPMFVARLMADIVHDIGGKVTDLNASGDLGGFTVKLDDGTDIILTVAIKDETEE